MNISNHAISAIFGGLLGIAGSAGYMLPKISELQNQMADRPPVLVVDMAKLAIDSVPVGAGEAAIKEHFRNTQEVIKKFKNAGFLILPRENIIASPAALMLNQNDLPANTQIKKKETNDENRTSQSLE